MSLIKKLEKELNEICVADKFDENKYDKLSNQLRSIDPYNNIFHLGCKNWPNCDTEGCGEGRGERW